MTTKEFDAMVRHQQMMGCRWSRRNKRVWRVTLRDCVLGLIILAAADAWLIWELMR